MSDSIKFSSYQSGTTTTVEIGGSATLKLLDDGYSPLAAPLRSHGYGNLPPYSDVQETMTLYATGTQAAISSALASLYAIANHVQRVRLGIEPSYYGTVGSYAFLHYTVNGGLAAGLVSHLTDMQISAPTTFKQLGNRTGGGEVYLGPITVSFVRRGWWHAEAGTNKLIQYTYGTAAAGTAYTDSAPDILAPLGIALELDATKQATEGYIIISDGTANIKHFEYESFTATVGAIATVADANASGGNKGRITVTTTANETALGFTKPGTYAVLIRLENDTDGAWTIRAALSSVGPSGAAVSTGYTPTTIVTTADATPQVHHAGTVTLSAPADTIEIEFVDVATSAGNFDVDDIWIVYLSPASRIIWHEAMSTGAVATAARLDWAYYEPSPILFLYDNGATDYYDYGAIRGDVMPVCLKTVAIAWVTCGTSNFNYGTVNGGAVHDINLLRYPAYLLPE